MVIRIMNHKLQHLNLYLFLEISKAQYQDLIMAAESLDRLTKAIPYRKYRPLLKEYKGHYKEW